jgi:hypothetical protein
VTRSILAFVCAAGAVALASAQTGPDAAGILPRLTVETYDQAKACGRDGEACAVEPYRLCPAVSQQYSVRLATPFSRVAVGVLENLKIGKPGRGMERGNANRWGTGVYVLPAERSSAAAGIDSLEIRREALVIQPLTRTVGPIAVTMQDGSSRQLSRGYFSFSPEAFAPGADIVLVFKGTAGEITCPVNRARLQVLR